ncbi:endonuclease/exonuclease/phosphatase family protein [Actinoplanes sp. NEAU-A12]|uniref:Endonuclease/exonuclease/phosphatase family protein n=1 Tax=Actinoplanes sandaracinus TaxID=3045177 RepID=A0ABT6X1H0_9ACTN|nr:endonuclease/exonuclease/phosphatase family protein [Actinoplanes sandaracinus]MDI6105853.1 endonuclease/exonuclease/phosphatase family protein [Actinoplanes sandaracinus]
MTHIDLERLGGLRNEIEKAAGTMEKRTTATPPLGGLSYPAFGNTPGSALCHEIWRDTMTEAQTAFEHLRFSVEADVGRLDAIMHTFSRVDAEAADDLCAAAMRSNSLAVHNTHVASGAGREAENVRRAQVGRAVDHIEAGAGGPAVFAGDFNTAEPPEVSRLQAQGWTDASTNAGGGPVGTHHGRPIDKVYAGPGVAVTGPARPIDGGPSDHDGLVVDVGVAPAWP